MHLNGRGQEDTNPRLSMTRTCGGNFAVVTHFFMNQDIIYDNNNLKSGFDLVWWRIGHAPAQPQPK